MAEARPLKLQSNWNKLALWPHQKAAIQLIRDYLHEFSAKPDSGSTLIRLPTGSGKTGIMGVVAQAFEDVNSVLIIAPWAQLTAQISKQVGVSFWEVVRAIPRDPLKPAHTFTPGTAESVLAKGTGTARIFVCTNQTLQTLHTTNSNVYERLRKAVSLVLVDEGHREPAPTWARSVRDLRKPTVLFTATPYRNDQRLFRINQEFIYRLAFASAVEQRFIRGVTFVEQEYGDGPTAFVKALLGYFDNLTKGLSLPGGVAPRVIVRCSTDADIRAVASALRKRGRSTVGIHEQFKSDGGDATERRVPDPATTKAQFWIHQNKLIEGVDDPSFIVLALYQPLSNARALVQQVGRVLRNPTRATNQRAYVFSHARFGQRRIWESFLRYEDRLGAGGREVGPAEVFEDLYQLQEQYQYLDGNFRQRFDPDEPDSHLHLKFPRSANVYRPSSNFVFDELTESFARLLDEEDYVLRSNVAPDADTRVLIYARCQASPLLSDRTFMELTLGFAIFRLHKGFLFVYDTEGLRPEYLSNRASRLAPVQLERLLSGSGTRVSQVSLINGDLNLYAVRRRSLAARAIDQLAPSLGDHTHFCSTATAVVETSAGSKLRQYVGFSRARVSQPSAGWVGYLEYIAWLDETARVLDDAERQPLDFLARFALHLAAPDAAEPTNVLIDIDDVAGEFTTVDGDPADGVLFEDRCWDISDGEFTCVAAGRTCRARIQYDRGRQRFVISSDDMASWIVERDVRGERRRNMVAHLNTEQAFRVVTADGMVYAHGHFYKSRFPLWGRRIADRIDLLNVLLPRVELGAMTSEKGKIGDPSGEGWEKGSVFEYIDRTGATGLLAQEKLVPDLLVCDDLGNELADFIALQRSPPRVVMIHAKSSDPGTQLSASAFHDVCGQATKNLGLLTPQWSGNVKNPRSWNGPWKEKAKVVQRRIRRAAAGMTAGDALNLIEEMVRHPSTTREVWVVMGHGLSRAALDAKRQRKSPEGQVIQLIYLLQATWSSVSSVGGIFKVFCMP